VGSAASRAGVAAAAVRDAVRLFASRAAIGDRSREHLRARRPGRHRRPCISIRFCSISASMRAMRWAERADAGERARARASDPVCTACRRKAPGDYVELCVEDEGQGIPRTSSTASSSLSSPPRRSARQRHGARQWARHRARARRTHPGGDRAGRGYAILRVVPALARSTARNGIRRRHTNASCRSALTGHVRVFDDEQT